MRGLDDLPHRPWSAVEYLVMPVGGGEVDLGPTADSRDLSEHDDRLRVSTSVRTMARAGQRETITSTGAT